jgi:hypothetical protein
MVPLTGQERAWTLPIWYTPSADARKNASAGMTAGGLKAKGATALGDAQLKALIVGKVEGPKRSNRKTATSVWFESPQNPVAVRRGMKGLRRPKSVTAPGRPADQLV